MAGEFLRRAKVLERMAARAENFVSDAAKRIVGCVRRGGKVYVLGNGGSATMSSHFVGEMVGRFKKERGPFPFLCPIFDVGSLTAISNDYGYDVAFLRILEATAKDGDLVFLLSTSGRSRNLVEVVKAKRRLGVEVVALLGRDGGTIAPLSDLAFVVDEQSSDLIQEVHLAVIHCLADEVERILTA